MVAVVTQGDEIRWARGFGNASTGQPMAERSRVEIASLTKSMTAVGVGTLLYDANISVGTRIHELLPELGMADKRYDSITVRQLLNHTSGLTDAAAGYYAAMNDGVSSVREHVARLAGKSLERQPGATFRYANINYILLGRLIEVLSGQPVDRYLQDHVFEEHGLTDTVLDGRDAPDGFNSVFGKWVARTDTSNPMASDPAGGAVTTAEDLGRWLIANNGAGPTPVSPQVRQIVQTTSVNSGSYAGGWDMRSTASYEHSGNRYTYSSYMVRNEAQGWGVAVVVNGASMIDPAYAIAEAIAAVIDPSRPQPGSTPSAVSADRWAALVVVASALATAVLLLRSPRWARRRGRVGKALGLAWPSCVVFAALCAPLLAGILMNGIDMEWMMLTYYSLTPLLVVIAMGAMAALVVGARTWALWKVVHRHD